MIVYACRIMSRFIAFLAASLLISQVQGQSLTDVVANTLQTNPDILAGKYNVEAAEQLRNQARSGYFPVVDLVIAGGREASNNTKTRTALVGT